MTQRRGLMTQYGNPRVFPMQVAHGLLMHWESQLSGTDRKPRRFGLGDLLSWAGLPSHTSKSGMALTCYKSMTGLGPA